MSRLRRLRGRGALMVVVATAMMLLSTSTANAHFLGGKFPHTAGNWLNLGYTTQGSYATQAHTAAASWHNTPTRLIVFQEDISVSEEDYYGFAYDATWWGLATLHPCAGNGCSYVWADLQLNTNTLNAETTFIQQKVAAHEFGHGIGLAHVVDGTVPSIMRQGHLSYNVPQQHDIDDVNILYP